MGFPSLFRRPKQHRHLARVRRIGNPSYHKRPFVPWLESLEDRTVLSTLTVLNNLDKGAGSLRDAIINAKSGDTIVFAPSLDGQTITLTSDQLTINKSLDIEGPGASLLAVSGNDTNRVFDINEGFTVTIAGLTITHGRTVGNNGGAGIQNVGSTLTLANDVLSDNVAFSDPNLGGRSTFPVGGAVRSRNSATLTVTNCTFTANQAVGKDGGGNAWGGGIANDTGSVATVTGCTFTGNRAVGGDGGKSSSGQFILGHGEGGGIANFSTLTVANSTFTANQAIGGNGCQGGSDNAPLYTLDVGNGGGIENFPQGSVLFVDGCTFAYNQAIGGSNATGSPGGQLGRLGNGSGGGVKNEAVATITNSTFDHNEAIGGSGNTGTASVVLNGVGQGGGIDNGTVGFAATLTASNLTITNNRAVGGTGNTGTAFAGAAFGGGFSNRSGSTATISNSTIEYNRAVGGAGADALGGGIANLPGCTLTVSGCVINGNQATGGTGGAGGSGGNGFGGGVYNDGQSSLTITGSTITNNQATGGAASSGGSTGQGEGGGVYFAAGGVVCLDLFTQAHVKNNHASTSDDDVFGVFSTC